MESIIYELRANDFIVTIPIVKEKLLNHGYSFNNDFQKKTKFIFGVLNTEMTKLSLYYLNVNHSE